MAINRPQRSRTTLLVEDPAIIVVEKNIEPGTWRYIGQRIQGFSPRDVPIAGASIAAIFSHFGGTPYRIGRIDPRNAFVLERGTMRLVYVRPDYASYRRAALKVFKSYGWRVDFDHALSRNLARKLGYKYVLLTRANPSVNRSHGRFERRAQISGISPTTCFVDTRIHDKMLGRKPLHMPGRSPQYYDPNSLEDHGFTLKQAGKWGYAVGVDDEIEVRHCLIPMNNRFII